MEDKILQAISIAVQTLADIKDISLDDDIRAQVKSKVLEVINIEPSKQYTPGSVDGIIQCIKQCGGCATRAEIASKTGMNPNVISALLSKLVKQNKIYKVPLEQSSVNRKGSGHIAEYAYQLTEIKQQSRG
jgi:hypothetical protein